MFGGKAGQGFRWIECGGEGKRADLQKTFRGLAREARGMAVSGNDKTGAGLEKGTSRSLMGVIFA